MREVVVSLTMREIAAIAQRSLAERITGEPWGVFSGLWRRIDAMLEEEKKPELEEAFPVR